jgi:hypothetical protein
VDKIAEHVVEKLVRWEAGATPYTEVLSAVVLYELPFL